MEFTQNLGLTLAFCSHICTPPMFSQAFSLAVWESLFPACVVRGRANLLLSFHSAAPIPLQSLSVFSLLLAVAGQQEEAPSLFHISSPLKYPLDVVLPFSYIRGRFVYCPFFLVQFRLLRRLFSFLNCRLSKSEQSSVALFCGFGYTDGA